MLWFIEPKILLLCFAAYLNKTQKNWINHKFIKFIEVLTSK